MKCRTYASIAVMAALGLSLPFQASALGLGKLELSSALNEPFNGEILVSSLRKGEFENIAVGLASSDEFQKAGLERPFLLSKLEFTVVKKKNGTVSIEIKSKQAIKEPFLDFLLVVSTGQNRMMREYTVLLDPPTTVFTRAEPQKKVQETSPEPAAPARVTPTPTSKTTSYQYDEAATGEMAGSYGPTNKYDTLWKLSSKLRVDKSVSVNQIMMAILKENPEAFQRNNINGLKAGQTLSVPAVDEIKSLSRSQAVTAVREQNKLWKQAKKKTTPKSESTAKSGTTAQQAVVAPTTSTEIETKSNEPGGSAKSLSDNTTATSQEPSASRLKLVTPSEEVVDPDNIELGTTGSQDIDKLSDQLTLAQETIAGQAQENIDFKARMDALEEQINTLHRLIEIKDANLARMQNRLETDEGSVSAATEEDALLREQLDVETGASELTVDAQDMEIPPPDSDIVDYAKPKPKLMPVPESTHVVAKNSVFNMVVQAISESKTQKLLGGVLILLILWLALRTRNATKESWQEAAMGGGTSSGSGNEGRNETVADQAENNVDDDSLTDREKTGIEETGVLTVDDLVTEADAYVTYDNYPRAEVLLEKARTVDPDNQEVGSKLLYVLFKQNRADEFINLAQELQAGIEKENPEKWSEICEWGNQIAPEHNFFNTGADLAFGTEEVLEELSANSEEKPSIETEDLEFDLGKFELGDQSVASEDDQPESYDLGESVADHETLDFDAPLELSIEPEGKDTTSPEEPSVDAELLVEDNVQETIQTDAGTEFQVDDVGDFDEAEMKLDLAVAYIDMGDPEGSISILEEVRQQGNDEQRERAQSLLNNNTTPEVSNDKTDDHVEAGLEVEELTINVEDKPSLEDTSFNIDNVDESETKLDLATAYLDIDDTDGARVILEEVINEGNNEQKKRAQDLLDNI